MLNAKSCCTEIDRSRSRGQAAGRRDMKYFDQKLKYQQALITIQEIRRKVAAGKNSYKQIQVYQTTRELPSLNNIQLSLRGIPT